MQFRISLVIFTCEAREYLLTNTIKSFKENCKFNFDKTILAIDGKVNRCLIELINPDIVIQHYKRMGYVHSISKALKIIDTPYFFWLEDDWTFNKSFSLSSHLINLHHHQNWTQILFSKFGPLNYDQKRNRIQEGLYETSFGFSANPSICNTSHIKYAFQELIEAPKGDRLGLDGFENYLSDKFLTQNLISVIIDPINHLPITHEGYLETTSRNWHMTNSLELKTKDHLSTLPHASIFRRLIMIVKLVVIFFKIVFRQLYNNKIYEYCFRIVVTSKTLKND